MVEAICYDMVKSKVEVLRKMIARYGNSSSGMESYQKSEFSIPSVDLIMNIFEVWDYLIQCGALTLKFHTDHFTCSPALRLLSSIHK